MKEKYYNLVETLVKEHQKFSQYEELLDEIINDVFNRAEVVLNNIKDEEILINYLNKTITTSLITIPKQLNVAPKRKTKFNVAELAVAKVESTTELVVEQEYKEEFAESSYIKNSIDTLFKASDLNNFELNSRSEESISLLEEVSENSFLVSSDNQNNDSLEVINSMDFDISTNLVDNKSDVDQTLVDNLINGISSKSEINETLTHITSDIENTSNSSDDENFITYENLDSVEIIEEQNYIVENCNNENEEILDCESDSEDIAGLQDFDIEPIESESILSETEEILDCESDSEDIAELQDFDIEPIESESILSETEEILDCESDSEDIAELQDFDIEPVESENILSETEEILDCESDSEDIAELQDFDIEPVESESILSETEEILDCESDSEDIAELQDFDLELTESEDKLASISIESEKLINSYEEIAPKYDCFEYEPCSINFDTDNICKKLLFLNKKYANMDIIKICELRYYQNLSVIEIAEQMNLQFDEVIEALDKITDSIKD